MKQIAAFILLAVLSIASSMPAQGQRISPQEMARQSQRAAKEQEKMLRKANKKQQKAAKKYEKQQRKAMKKTTHHA